MNKPKKKPLNLVFSSSSDTFTLLKGSTIPNLSSSNQPQPDGSVFPLPQQDQHVDAYASSIAQHPPVLGPISDPSPMSATNSMTAVNSSYKWPSGHHKSPYDRPSITPSTTDKVKTPKEKLPVIRKAGGEAWIDPTLDDWDESTSVLLLPSSNHQLTMFCSVDDYRIFCGDLGPEVNDELLRRTFDKYPSLVKARVVYDKAAQRSKGYGFVSFKNVDDFILAMREVNGIHALIDVLSLSV